MDRREELERWIAGTRRTQQRLKVILPIAAAVALALCFVNRFAGGMAIATVALVALSGFWITGGHIADWEEKLYKLDHPEKPSTGKRRYQAD
jgi:hypothetical protein